MKEEVFDELEGKIMNGVSSTFTATEVVKNEPRATEDAESD